MNENSDTESVSIEKTEKPVKSVKSVMNFQKNSQKMKPINLGLKKS